MVKKLVLIRHGESTWNKENIFQGWIDVDLSETGIQDAHESGKTLKKEGYVFDITYTSLLKRAIRTLDIVLDEMELMWIPVVKSWRLNERHYGALQGLNKAETAKRFGEEQVKIWRRSYNVQPPALEKTDEQYPGYPEGYPAHGMLEGHGGPVLAVVEWYDRTRGEIGKSRVDRRARQLSPRLGQIS